MIVIDFFEWKGMMVMLTDLEIAQQAEILPIELIAKK